MASPKSFVFFTLLSLNLGMIAAVPAYPAGNLQKFHGNNYELRWAYIPSQQKIHFQIRVPINLGYVALAFPYIDAHGNNKMDVVVANQGYITDLHLTNSGTLAPDQSQDYTLESFSQTTQETVVEFSRSKSTGNIDDITFVAAQPMIVRWDYGPSNTYSLAGLLSNLNLNSHQSLQQITFVPK